MKAKFSLQCDVIFLVRLQEKFDIDHSQEWNLLDILMALMGLWLLKAKPLCTCHPPETNWRHAKLQWILTNLKNSKENHTLLHPPPILWICCVWCHAHYKYLFRSVPRICSWQAHRLLSDTNCWFVSASIWDRLFLECSFENRVGRTSKRLTPSLPSSKSTFS